MFSFGGISYISNSFPPPSASETANPQLYGLQVRMMPASCADQPCFLSVLPLTVLHLLFAALFCSYDECLYEFSLGQTERMAAQWGLYRGIVESGLFGCDAGNPCTGGDACRGDFTCNLDTGFCERGTPHTCLDGQKCELDALDAAVCVDIQYLLGPLVLSGAQKEIQRFGPLDGTKQFTVQLSGGTGDADLYTTIDDPELKLKGRGSPNYDCSSLSSTSNESCVYSGTGTDVYVWVEGWSSFAEVTLTVIEQ